MAAKSILIMIHLTNGDSEKFNILEEYVNDYIPDDKSEYILNINYPVSGKTFEFTKYLLTTPSENLLERSVVDESTEVFHVTYSYKGNDHNLKYSDLIDTIRIFDSINCKKMIGALMNYASDKFEHDVGSILSKCKENRFKQASIYAK